MRHRGPDGVGFHHQGPVALGHARLSIIDVEAGAQPQFNEDGSIAIVFNGEIYNYKELMADLRQRHLFRTASDTEVLLHLYEDFGLKMLRHLRGMFAFAIWDARTQTLFAARDRFGEKPFYYTFDGERLTFASEFQALEAGGADLGAIDQRSLSAYLELLYIPSPHTIRAGVRKLPPGHLLIADKDGLKIERYWETPSPGSAGGISLSPKLLRDALQKAVQLSLRSDVPVGALLSGGVDSSAVVGLLAQELGPGVKTYSVGFGKNDDELPFARTVAAKHQTDHHEIVLDENVEDSTIQAFKSFGEPFGDSSVVPTIAVFREVAKHVKVVLTGDGGDELFAGYDRYRRVQSLPHWPTSGLGGIIDRVPNWGRLPSVARAARIVGSRQGARHRANVEIFPADQRRALMGQDYESRAEFPDLPEDGDSALAFDLAVYLPDDLLFKTDTASMRWGVESRCPLLDHVLASVVIPRPLSEKITLNSGKLLFKHAIRDLVPEAILTRPKRGFGSPVKHWLRGPLNALFMDLLASPGARIRSWFDNRALNRVVASATSATANPHQAWALLSLEAWAREHGI